jgi:hypothetical protein
MAADADAEIEATLTRARTLVGGRVWESALPDDANPPRDANGAIKPYIILDFGAVVRSTRDRTLAHGDLKQPHILPVNAACVAGDVATARAVQKALFNLLVDWAPSSSADAYRAQGGYGSNRPATGNTPTRFVRGGFYETTVNNVT